MSLFIQPTIRITHSIHNFVGQQYCSSLGISFLSSGFLHISVFRPRQLDDSASDGVSWNAFKISHLFHPLRASHTTPTGQAGCVLTQRLRRKDKKFQLSQKIKRCVCILLKIKLELTQYYFLLILLDRAQSGRRWTLIELQGQVLDMGRVEN